MRNVENPPTKCTKCLSMTRVSNLLYRCGRNCSSTTTDLVAWLVSFSSANTKSPLIVVNVALPVSVLLHFCCRIKRIGSRPEKRAPSDGTHTPVKLNRKVPIGSVNETRGQEIKANKNIRTSDELIECEQYQTQVLTELIAFARPNRQIYNRTFPCILEIQGHRLILVMQFKTSSISALHLSVRICGSVCQIAIFRLSTIL